MTAASIVRESSAPCVNVWCPRRTGTRSVSIEAISLALTACEMMTRIADGTGARHAVGRNSDVVEIGRLTGADEFESAR